MIGVTEECFCFCNYLQFVGNSKKSNIITRQPMSNKQISVDFGPLQHLDSLFQTFSCRSCLRSLSCCVTQC